MTISLGVTLGGVLFITLIIGIVIGHMIGFPNGIISERKRLEEAFKKQADELARRQNQPSIPGGRIQ